MLPNDFLAAVHRDRDNVVAGAQVFKSIDMLVEQYKESKRVQEMEEEERARTQRRLDQLALLLKVGSIVAGAVAGTVVAPGPGTAAGAVTAAKIAKPVLEAASEVTKYFSSQVGKSKTEDVSSVLPVASMSEMSFTGTITDFTPYSGKTISTPGTGTVSQATLSYPLYNEVLGTFALLETPKVDLLRFEADELNSGGYRSEGFTLKLDASSVKYRFNPAAGVLKENTQIFTRLVYHAISLHPQFLPGLEDDALPINAELQAVIRESEDIGVVPDLDEFVYHSPMLPIEYIGSVQTGLINDVLNVSFPTGDGLFLQVVILYEFDQLDRNGEPNRALQILTYPAKYGAVESNGNDPTSSPSFVNAPIDLVIDGETYTDSDPIYAWNTITITGSVSSTVPTRLIAGDEVIVTDEAEVGNNIIQEQGYPVAATPILEASDGDVNTFCGSSNYRASSLSAQMLAQEPTPEVASRKAVIPLTAAPNPFSTATELRYELPAAGRVELYVSDLMGQRVATLVDGRQAAGPQTATFRPQGARRGLYVATLRTDHGVGTRLIELR